jgi:hypothetical protein
MIHYQFFLKRERERNIIERERREITQKTQKKGNKHRGGNMAQKGGIWHAKKFSPVRKRSLRQKPKRRAIFPLFVPYSPKQKILFNVPEILW